MLVHCDYTPNSGPLNIASVYGLVAPSRSLQVAYTVAKHALIGLLRVNAVGGVKAINAPRPVAQAALPPYAAAARAAWR
jgi:NAD(P)-dependent dehydrogenase (short-subunit alcohol dehydrogenase family)